MRQLTLKRALFDKESFICWKIYSGENSTHFMEKEKVNSSYLLYNEVKKKPISNCPPEYGNCFLLRKS